MYGEKNVSRYDPTSDSFIRLSESDRNSRQTIENSESNNRKTIQRRNQQNNRTNLENRVSGDALFDAQDLIEEIKEVGAKVDDNGYYYLVDINDNRNIKFCRENRINNEIELIEIEDSNIISKLILCFEKTLKNEVND